MVMYFKKYLCKSNVMYNNIMKNYMDAYNIIYFLKQDNSNICNMIVKPAPS